MRWEDLIKYDNLCNASPLASIVFCCKATKDCPFRKEALNILGIGEEVYTAVKEENGIKAKGTCYGNLAYCCSLNVQCEARDAALKEAKMSHADYLKYKFRLLRKLIPKDKLEIAMETRVTYMYAFEIVDLHSMESCYRGICIGNPELTNTMFILNYQNITPDVDLSVKDALKKEKLLSVRISREKYDKLIDLASENSCNVSDVVREAIDLFLSIQSTTSENIAVGKTL